MSNVAVRPFRVLSLCAGVGGLDLGVKLAVPGARTVGYCEREAFAASVIVARIQDKALDDAPIWDDIATFDGQPWRGSVDCIIAGYPCSPFSYAGRRGGTADPRHLWPHVARIIREVAPTFVFLENVPGHLNLGFREVRDELQEMGYRVEAGIYSAAECGASHLRKRLFVLAMAHSRHHDGSPEQKRQRQTMGREQLDGDDGETCLGAPSDMGSGRGGRDMADAGRQRLDPDQSGRSGREGGPGSAVTGESGTAMEDAIGRFSEGRGRTGRIETGTGAHPEPSGSSEVVGHPDEPGLQGWHRPESESAHERPAWPPSPTDIVEWQRVLQHEPTLEPALGGPGRRLNPRFVEWLMGLPLNWSDPTIHVDQQEFRKWKDNFARRISEENPPPSEIGVRKLRFNSPAIDSPQGSELDEQRIVESSDVVHVLSYLAASCRRRDFAEATETAVSLLRSSIVQERCVQFLSNENQAVWRSLSETEQTEFLVEIDRLAPWMERSYPAARSDRLRTLGNAVVPVVAALAFRSLASRF
jgi:DNA (cytosine-5)-methyltransferase 1